MVLSGLFLRKMAQSNRWYPQLRTAPQDLISAISGAFDRIYTNQDRIDSITGASGRVVLAKITVSGADGEMVFENGLIKSFVAPT